MHSRGYAASAALTIHAGLIELGQGLRRVRRQYDDLSRVGHDVESGLRREGARALHMPKTGSSR
jgi:hypothetical protein